MPIEKKKKKIKKIDITGVVEGGCISPFIDCAHIKRETVLVRDTYLPAILVKSELCHSNSEARRIIRTQGIIINDQKITDCDYKNNLDEFNIDHNDRFLKIVKA